MATAEEINTLVTMCREGYAAMAFLHENDEQWSFSSDRNGAARYTRHDAMDIANALKEEQRDPRITYSTELV